MAALSAAFRPPKPEAYGRLLALECQFLLIQPEARLLEFLDLGLGLLTFNIWHHSTAVFLIY